MEQLSHQQNPLTGQEIQDKTQALISYVLLILGSFTGIFWFIGGVWAFFKRNDARQGRFYGHFSNILSVFIYGLIWSILGLILSVVIVGYFILAASFIWVIYRVVKGIALLTSDKPYE